MAVRSQNVVEIVLTAQDKASREVDKLSKSMDGLDRSTKTTMAGIAAASAAVSASIIAATIQGARFSDQLDDLSDRTLVSRETLAAIGVQLARVGEDFFGSEVAVRTFSRALVDMKAGQEETVKAFRALKIEFGDVVGPGGTLKSFEELLPLIAERFSQLGDAATKVDVAVSLFGRSGTAMIPVLSRGARGIEDLKNQARDLIPIGEDAANKLGELDDSASDLKISMQGAQAAIGSALAPTLTDIVKKLTDATKATAAYANEHPHLIKSVTDTTTAIAGGAGLGLALFGIKNVLTKINPLVAITTALMIGMWNSFDPEKVLEDWLALQNAQKNFTASLRGLQGMDKVVADQVRGPVRELVKARQDWIDILAQGAATSTQKPSTPERQQRPQTDEEKERAEKLAEANRKAAETAHDLKLALLEIDAASGQITDTDLLAMQIESFARAREELDMARERQAALKLGTEEYRKAVEDTQRAVDNYRDAEEAVGESLSTVKESRREAIDAARAYQQALQDLADAKRAERAAHQEARGDEKGAEATRQEIARAAAIREMTEAEREWVELLAMGPVLAEDQTRVLEQLTRTQEGYNTALSGTKTQATDASLAIGQMTGGLASFGGQAGKAISAVGELVQALIALKKAKDVLGKFGAFGGFLGVIGSIVGLIGAQSGGTIRTGIRGRDTVPIAAGRGETVLDHTLTDDLRAMVRGGGGRGATSPGLQVSFNVHAPFMVTREDGRRFAKEATKELDRYNNEFLNAPRFAT